MTKGNWSGSTTLLVFLALTAAGFIAWVVGLALLWLALRAFGLNANYWAMTEALSTAAAAATVVGAAFFAYRELSEVANSRHMEVADRLFEELNSPENIAARRWVFQNLPSDPQEGLREMSAEGRAHVKKVLNSLDRVAFLTQSGWIPDEVIMPWMHPMIAKSWEKIGPYVLYERERRNEPYYYRYASELAERCQAWRSKRLPDQAVKWVEGAL